MRWKLSWRADPAAKVLADRHYNRQNPNSAQFVPPGRCLVLLSVCGKALWVTSWPLAKYTKHAWAGAWVCSCFRNEGAGLSSELIKEAVAATVWKFGAPPDLGMITFVDRGKTKPKKDPGYCYQVAGFSRVGRTKDRGLYALQILPGDMPQAEPPIGGTEDLFPATRAIKEGEER